MSRLLLLLAFVPALAQAEMYKCVDERGKVSYEDKSRTGCKRVDIQGSPPISGKLEAGSSDPAAANADFKRRQIERERANEAEARAREQEARRCAAVRDEIARLNNGRRLVEKTTPTGERVYMDDQTREQKIAEASAGLRGCP